jgi:glycosyltransferase involved in cell wall biosynthesis
MNGREKHILYIRTDLGTNDLIGGGSVAHTLGVINGFTQLGHKVTVASSAMHRLLSKKIGYFHALQMPRWLKPLGFKINALISNIIFYYKTKKLIKEHDINLIYQRYSMLNAVALALAYKFNIPFYLEFNGSEVWIDQHWVSNKRIHLTWLIEKIELLNLMYADKIIVVSQVLKEQLIAKGIDANKIVMSPNGVDLQVFSAQHLQCERTVIRNELNIQDVLVFGFSGTFGPWHGIEIIARIIPAVVKQNQQVHFLLIGDGLLKEMIQKMVKQEHLEKFVTFVGMIHSDQMPAYLSACDAFLCPTQPNNDGTRFFGSPTKLFEYMAMAKPIIASDIEQLAELLHAQREVHLLIEPNDIEGFVQAILHVITMHPLQREQIGNVLQEQVKQNFTWKIHVERFFYE